MHVSAGMRVHPLQARGQSPGLAWQASGHLVHRTATPVCLRLIFTLIGNRIIPPSLSPAYAFCVYLLS
jgi:hypothetical protein